MDKVQNNPTKPKIIEDAILTGIVDAFRVCRITPQKNANGRTEYLIEGNSDEVLSRIYANEPVGALDVLKSIKWARQAIFNYRNTKEEGEEYDSRSVSKHR